MARPTYRLDFTVTLPFCSVAVVRQAAGDYVSTRWDDGLEAGNWPSPGDESFVAWAGGLGFSRSELLVAVHQHELAHVLVPWRLFGERGYVARMSAQGRKMSLAGAKAEERLIYYVSRLAHDLDEATLSSATSADLESAVAQGLVSCCDDQWVRPAAELLQALRAWRRGETTFSLV